MGTTGIVPERLRQQHTARRQSDATPEEALSVLTPYPADLLEAFAVSTAVISPGRDAPEMVEPLAM